MARRNVLHGASAWEREEKANQQRDYAAQLQQQVLQKQAKQEQEKARKQQEQREELEMLERQQAAANRNHHPQQEQVTPEPPPLDQSHQRTGFVSVADPPHQGMHHLTSPSKTISAGVSVAATEPVQDIPAFSPASYSGGSESYVSTFSSSPSIFETLLREPGIGARSVAFYEDLATLHQLTAELDSVAKQRHAKAQNSYNKPDFVHPEEISPPPAFSSTSLRSPVKLSPDKAPHEDNQVENAAVSQQKMKSSVDGLQGESVLLPIETTIPSTKFNQSKNILKLQANSPMQVFDTGSTVEDEEVLENHSEMMRFTDPGF